ncbi:ABC transporter permease [Paracoccus cavernae]|uniref:ABC transporter permease n=1 Tax=Paracoccus cavernae TaxID=1571207 RepID=A0ABT8D809_9RHOB|nr:ABC transporter permease [Paracoccus cavernae]
MSTDTTAAAKGRPNVPRSAFWGGLLRNAGIGVALVLLIIVFSLTTKTFLTQINLSNIMVQITLNVILAAGMTFVILIGGIDLSVGSVMALAAVIAATFMSNPDLPSWLAITLTILVACGVGTFCGIINGLISAWWSILLHRDAGHAEHGARLRAAVHPIEYGLYLEPRFHELRHGQHCGRSLLFIVALIVVGLGWVVLTRTVFGRMLYAIGNNEEAVRLAGHNTLVYKTAAFGICGFAVGIAAVMYMARLTSASPIMGNGYELNAIAAVIIGGTSLNGGRGSMIGTLLGAAVIGVLGNGLILIGASDFVRQIITGAVIILAVILDAVQNRIAQRRGAR